MENERKHKPNHFIGTKKSFMNFSLRERASYFKTSLFAIFTNLKGSSNYYKIRFWSTNKKPPKQNSASVRFISVGCATCHRYPAPLSGYWWPLTWARHGTPPFPTHPHLSPKGEPKEEPTARWMEPGQRACAQI